MTRRLRVGLFLLSVLVAEIVVGMEQILTAAHGLGWYGVYGFVVMASIIGFPGWLVCMPFV